MAWLKGIILSQDIFDYYSIIVEIKPKLRGFTKFTKSSLSVHVYSGACNISHLHPQVVHDGTNKDFNKRNNETEYEINIYHLDVGGRRQTIAHLKIHPSYKLLTKHEAGLKKSQDASLNLNQPIREQQSKYHV